ncbi:MAG: hypothetical protein ACYDC2_13755, partial [Solirubrobacteraceae bacterium]
MEALASERAEGRSDEVQRLAETAAKARRSVVDEVGIEKRDAERRDDALDALAVAAALGRE